MTNDDQVIDLLPVETERLSAAAFLRLVKENPSIIKSSSIIHPTPGKAGFGSFQVVYTRPMYRAPFGHKSLAGAK